MKGRGFYQSDTTAQALAADTAAKRWRITVAVPVPLFQSFDYLWHQQLPDGCRVRIPFGPRSLTGIVIDAQPEQEPPQSDALKHIDSVLDLAPLVDASLLALLHWAARYYHHPVGEVLPLAFPAALRRGEMPPTQEVFRVVEQFDAAQLQRAKQQASAFAHLQRFPNGLSREQLREGQVSAATLRALQARGAIVAAQEDFTGAAVLHETPAAAAQGVTQSYPLPDSAAICEDAEFLNLTAEQAQVVAQLKLSPAYTPVLLFGITGSGKTEVYLHAIRDTLAGGRRALVLVPEIGLTPQTVARFANRFRSVAAIHSGMSDRQRSVIWSACRSGRVDVLIGTRSAIFTPLPNLGLIIVDEEHDPSFKQQDGFRYSARDIAVKRAASEEIPVVLGSATPSFESFANATSGQYALFELTQRPGSAEPPAMVVADIRGQKLHAGLSPATARALRETLHRGEQVLVYLNRRGFAPVLHCPDCGWMAQCQRCDVRLTVHRAPPGLRCHHCGARHAPMRNCPECASNLITTGVGTQQAEDQIIELAGEFPVIRIDRDTTRSRAALEAALEQMNEGNPAVLLGTQMIAKGHHFPEVTQVIILEADAGLFSGDFRGPERMAQIITQVSGRAGRGERPGTVLLQTHHPDHPLLQLVVAGDYRSFATQLLAERKQAGLPPFGHMALLRADAIHASRGETLLRELAEQLRQVAKHSADDPKRPQVRILGPVPAPIQRLADHFRSQLLLLATHRGALHKVLNACHDVISRPGSGIRCSIDVDPADMG